MFRTAGILLAATLLLTATAVAQQRPHGHPSDHPYGYHLPPGPGYRAPGLWVQPAPTVVLAPFVGLLGLLMAPPPAVIVAPVGVPVGGPPGDHYGHADVPHRVASRADQPPQ